MTDESKIHGTEESNPSDQSTEKAPSRRKLIKAIAGAAGGAATASAVPSSWTKPIVNAVMLPAHAQTTGPTTTPPPAGPTPPPQTTPPPTVGCLIQTCDANLKSGCGLFTGTVLTSQGILVTLTNVPAGANVSWMFTQNPTSAQIKSSNGGTVTIGIQNGSPVPANNPHAIIITVDGQSPPCGEIVWTTTN